MDCNPGQSSITNFVKELSGFCEEELKVKFIALKESHLSIVNSERAFGKDTSIKEGNYDNSRVEMLVPDSNRDFNPDCPFNTEIPLFFGIELIVALVKFSETKEPLLGNIKALIFVPLKSRFCNDKQPDIFNIYAVFLI
jgi:hypothetical protein